MVDRRMTGLDTGPAGFPAGPGPAAMSDQAAAWVRDNAWTNAMRKTHREVPRFYTTCSCEYGRSLRCARSQHHQCAAGTPLRSEETIIHFGDGRPAHFAEDYAHPTDNSATGPRRIRLAAVWLADRVCRWICPCDCHTAPEQLDLDLFAELA